MSKDKYLKIASQAAHLERFRNFTPASELWLIAQGLAVTQADCTWCELRADTCRVAAEGKRFSINNNESKN